MPDMNENAELKEEMKAKQVVLNDFKSRVETVTDRFNKKSSQLTKAKEIISEFIEWANWQGSKCPSFKSIQDKAEQFLKDCDIDNAIQQANKGLDFDKIADEMEQDLKDSEVEK